jgi:hypothetical protein
MEPNSIHTYLDSRIIDIYAYDVDIRITSFPQFAYRSWLYYFALQVNFTNHDEWSHGGFQWAGVNEFQESQNKGINWGGGSEYGEIGINNSPFVWHCGKWYRYHVERVNKNPLEYNHWLFAVMDYDTNEEHQYGVVRTKSFFMKKAMVFTETGYGVQCDSPKAQVEWRNPCFLTPAGSFMPKKIVAKYNGTCINPTNTNQGLLSKSPLHWFHETNAIRIVLDGTKLWSS